MPIYNCGQYLTPAIDSVLKQSFNDFELLLIDDGSTDGSLDILRAVRDSRVQVIENGKNLGLIATLNRGVDLAKGDYIARMDGDDICLPQRFTRQLECLQGSAIDVCGTWTSYIGSFGAKVFRYDKSHDSIKFRLLFGSALSHPTVMARAAVLKTHPYNPDYAHAEDYALWTELVKSGIQFANIPEVLFRYRKHVGQVSQTKKKQQLECSAHIAREYAKAVLLSDELAVFEKFVFPEQVSYSLDQLEAFIPKIIQIGQRMGASSETCGAIIVNFFRRSWPLSHKTMKLLKKLEREHNVQASYLDRLQLVIQASLGLRRGHPLYEKLKWIL